MDDWETERQRKGFVPRQPICPVHPALHQSNIPAPFSEGRRRMDIIRPKRNLIVRNNSTRSPVSGEKPVIVMCG